MLTLVIGGAASGKSAYAENLTLKHPLPRYYVATMQVWDEECAKRVEKHRAMRKEKQFETIESPISLDKIRIPNRGIVLLEDLGNLIANELYDPKGAGVNTAEAVLYGVEILYKQCEHLIVVGNEAAVQRMPTKQICTSKRWRRSKTASLPVRIASAA